MAKQTANAPLEKVALYEKVVATLPEVERKGAGFPYTSVNGNMFSLLSPDGTVSLRLAPADREAFLVQFDTKLHEAYGIVQKEYVDVPDSLLQDTKQLAIYFRKSFEYASSLRPKPTTKKKP